ncbi:hypothetical protein ACGF5F_15535 [Streptomyces sp. NPDC047821]|uniref:hypothetical protein n=2 Tax=unclassified Streptomyces TaxID=2593676 RepID=UPI0037192DA9
MIVKTTLVRLLAPLAALMALLAALSAPAHATAGGSAAAAVRAQSTAAAAEGRYNILISHRALFVADFCLLSTTSGNQRAACSGNKPLGTDFRLGVVHKPGDRVWIDVNVVSGRDTKGIDLRGNRMCRVDSTAINLNVHCWKNLAHYESGAPGERVYG